MSGPASWGSGQPASPVHSYPYLPIEVALVPMTYSGADSF